MSAFELAAWNWSCGNVNNFNLEAGLLPDLVRDLGLTGKLREMFLTALNMIYVTFSKIDRKAAEKKRG